MNEKRSTRKKIIADVVLAASLIAVSLVLLLVFKLTRDGGAVVRVSVNGELADEYSLSHNGEYPLNGGTNILVIEDGEAYIKEANCPDKICVHSGKISLVGQQIVCLPNKLMVQIVE